MRKTRKTIKTRRQKKQYGGGILHDAVEANNLDKVKELIAQGVDINEKDKYGVTALSIASATGNINIVNELLKVPEININLQDDFIFNTPLINALIYKHYDVAHKLLDRNDININLVSSDGNSALLHAVLNDNIDIINKLISKPDININLQNQNGETALIRAIIFNKTNIAKALLDIPDINVNIQTNGGISALMWAVESTNKVIVERLLVMPGININAHTLLGETALSISNRVLHQGRGVIRVRAQQIRDLLVAAGAIDRPAIQPVIVDPFQVHTAFKKVKVTDFLNLIKQKVGDKNSEIPKTNKEMSDYIKSKLDSFVIKNNTTNTTNTTNTVINNNLTAIYNTHIKNTTEYTPLERQLFFYTLEYVSKQVTKFKRFYVASFAEDCVKAYTKITGSTMSCGGGVKERLILSLDSAITANSETSGITPEYKKILHYIDPTRYPLNTNSVTNAEYIRLMNQFGSVCIKSGTTKETFIDCMKNKLREELGERYNESDVIEKLNKYANNTGYFNNNNTSGGKRTLRKKYRKTCRVYKFY